MTRARNSLTSFTRSRSGNVRKIHAFRFSYSSRDWRCFNPASAFCFARFCFCDFLRGHTPSPVRAGRGDCGEVCHSQGWEFTRHANNRNRCANWDILSRRNENFLQDTGRKGLNLDCRFFGVYFGNRVAFLDRVAFLLQPARDGAARHIKAQSGEEYICCHLFLQVQGRRGARVINFSPAPLLPCPLCLNYPIISFTRAITWFSSGKASASSGFEYGIGTSTAPMRSTGASR